MNIRYIVELRDEERAQLQELAVDPAHVLRDLAKRRLKPSLAQPIRLRLHDPDSGGRHHDVIDVAPAAQRFLHITRERTASPRHSMFDEIAHLPFRFRTPAPSRIHRPRHRRFYRGSPWRGRPRGPPGRTPQASRLSRSTSDSDYPAGGSRHSIPSVIAVPPRRRPHRASHADTLTLKGFLHPRPTARRSLRSSPESIISMYNNGGVHAYN